MSVRKLKTQIEKFKLFENHQYRSTTFNKENWWVKIDSFCSLSANFENCRKPLPIHYFSLLILHSAKFKAISSRNWVIDGWGEGGLETVFGDCCLGLNGMVFSRDIFTLLANICVLFVPKGKRESSENTLLYFINALNTQSSLHSRHILADIKTFVVGWKSLWRFQRRSTCAAPIHAANVTTERSISAMDQISIKTPNPKCRLYWCLI